MKNFELKYPADIHAIQHKDNPLYLVNSINEFKSFGCYASIDIKDNPTLTIWDKENTRTDMHYTDWFVIDVSSGAGHFGVMENSEFIKWYKELK